MRRAYKYRLEVVGDYQVIRLPLGAKFLHARVDQEGEPIWLWFEVETNRDVGDRYFEVYPTGYDIDDGLHVATVATLSGHLVWHIYEL